jgi:hypothetical protein
MNFKKKAVVTTLAATLAIGTIAGLPLSTQGALSKLGVSNVALANAPALGNTTILNELTNVHNNLTDTEKVSVRAARTALGTLDPMNANDQALVSDIMALINAKIAANGKTAVDYPLLNSSSILQLFVGLNLAYMSDGSEVNAYKELNREVFTQLAQLGGSTIGTGGLTIDAAGQFATSLQTAIGKALSSPATIAAGLGSAKETARSIVKTALQTVLNDTNNASNPVVTVLKNIDTTNTYDGVVNALDSTFNKIGARVDADSSARIALALSEVRSHSDVVKLGNSTDGRTANYQYKILGNVVPVAAYSVVASSSDVNVSKNDSTNAFTLLNRTTNNLSTGVTVTLTGTGTALDGKILYTSPSDYISLNPVNISTGGGGGGGGIPDTVKPIVDAAKTVGSAISDLAKAKDQLDKATTAAEKKKIIDEMKATIAAAVAQISHLDISAAIKIDKDTATVALNTAELTQQIKDIMAQVDKLNAALKDADPTAKPVEAKITLDLGNLKVNNAEITLNKDILKAAKDAGVGKIEVKANGVGVAFGAGMFTADTTLSIKKDDAKVATAVTKQKVASDVYEFEFKSDGKAVTNFSQPVTLTMPVTVDKVDTELLTIGKIIDGKIIPYGGKYNATDKQVSTNRNSFSTYTVIENKVTFNDIASVQDWAGRQIQVAAAKGIIEGRADGQFVPNDTVTRAEFAKLIVTAFTLQDDSAKNTFKDVNSKDWFAPYVAAAAKAGIINGRSADQFDPNGEITRAEMATMASRALVATGNFQYEKDADAALKNFKDADDIGSSLKDGVALAAKLGIVVGEDGSVFNPNDDSTRAQAAVVIYRLLNAQ